MIRESFDINNTRHIILHQYARWCAFSSTRSGSPLKARKDVYPLIDLPLYSEILTRSTINENDFLLWHKRESTKIVEKSNEKLSFGWATKLINMYLKTMVYVGNIGPKELCNYIHPPIDKGLWNGIRERSKCKDTLSKTHVVQRIKHIDTYDKYLMIIEGIKSMCKDEGWKLIEIEKVWQGTKF